VTTKAIQTQQETTVIYDAVVANGHYDDPFIPIIVGIEAWNEAYPDAI
jgi:cation diffusion facilitator CzcD-associated flavoprotein CzcO